MAIEWYYLEGDLTMGILDLIRSKKYTNERVTELTGLDLTSVNSAIINKADQSEVDDLTSILAQNAKNTLDEINVVEMGADNTGVNDCTTLINSLLTTYKNVYLPKGIFKITNIIIPEGACLRGAGTAITTLKAVNTSGYAIKSADYAVLVNLKGFTLDGIGSTADGINFSLLSNEGASSYDNRPYLSEVWVKGFTNGKGLYLGSLTREARINNVIISGCQYGLMCDGTDNIGNGITTYLNTKNNFVLNGSANIFSNVKSFLSGVEGVMADNEGSGILVSGFGENTLQNVISQQNYGNGFTVLSDTNTIKGAISAGNNYKGKHECNGLVVAGSFNNIDITLANPEIRGAIRSVVEIKDSGCFNKVNAVYNSIESQIIQYLSEGDYIYTGTNLYKYDVENPTNQVAINNENLSSQISAMSDLLSLNGGYNNNVVGADTITLSSGELLFTLKDSSSARRTIELNTLTDLNSLHHLIVMTDAKTSKHENYYPMLYVALSYFTNVGQTTWSDITDYGLVSRADIKYTLNNKYQKISGVFNFSQIASLPNFFGIRKISVWLSATKRATITDGNPQSVNFKNVKIKFN